MYQKTNDENHVRKRILFVIGSLALGGAELQMSLLIKHLERLNFDCHLFVLEASGPLKKILKKLNVSIHNGGYDSRKPKVTKILLLIQAQLRLFHIVRDIEPDIIHAYLPLTNFMGSFAGRVLRVPLIIISKRALGTHQDHNKGWIISDTAAFRFSHFVTVNSKAVNEDTIKRDMGDASKIRLIYNGLDLEDFTTRIGHKREILKTLNIDPRKKIIITVANLIPYKGHTELLTAAAIVGRQFPDSIFLLVGEDRGIQKGLEQQTRELGINNNIIFLGQRRDIPELMAASDISVLPSHEEGFSNVVLESMAAGLPVVATRVGGNPEAIIDGETGWLVPPKKPTELASKILDLLNDPEKAGKWGEAGRLRVKQNFSHEKMVAEFVKLYSIVIPC